MVITMELSDLNNKEKQEIQTIKKAFEDDLEVQEIKEYNSGNKKIAFEMDGLHFSGIEFDQFYLKKFGTNSVYIKSSDTRLTVELIR